MSDKVKVKVTDFLNCLCYDFNYRLFSGVPTKGLKIIYDNMDPEAMLYIPAVDESVALGIISGAFISGYKGAVVLDHRRFNVVHTQMCLFNVPNSVCTLFITDSCGEIDLPVWHLADGLKILNDIDTYINIDNNGSGVLVIDEGVLCV